MSTEIATISGRKEGMPLSRVPVYVESDLYITRFYGGRRMGDMLQLTISNDEGHSYIQLTQKQVNELVRELLLAFDHKIYPSE